MTLSEVWDNAIRKDPVGRRAGFQGYTGQVSWLTAQSVSDAFPPRMLSNGSGQPSGGSPFTVAQPRRNFTVFPIKPNWVVAPGVWFSRFKRRVTPRTMYPHGGRLSTGFARSRVPGLRVRKGNGVRWWVWVGRAVFPAKMQYAQLALGNIPGVGTPVLPVVPLKPGHCMPAAIRPTAAAADRWSYGAPVQPEAFLAVLSQRSESPRQSAFWIATSPLRRIT